MYCSAKFIICYKVYRKQKHVYFSTAKGTLQYNKAIRLAK